MHSVTAVYLNAFIAISVMLAGSILAGAMIHALFAGIADLGQELILQGMTAFSVAAEERFHGLDLRCVKINFHGDIPFPGGGRRFGSVRMRRMVRTDPV